MMIFCEVWEGGLLDFLKVRFRRFRRSPLIFRRTRRRLGASLGGYVLTLFQGSLGNCVIYLVFKSFH